MSDHVLLANGLQVEIEDNWKEGNVQVDISVFDDTDDHKLLTTVTLPNSTVAELHSAWSGYYGITHFIKHCDLFKPKNPQ